MKNPPSAKYKAIQAGMVRQMVRIYIEGLSGVRIEGDSW